MQEQIISLAVYLEDSDLENGCFQLIPGNDTPYGKLSESNELFLRSTLHGSDCAWRRRFTPARVLASALDCPPEQ